MPHSPTATETMDREFLDIRARLLQLASHFDRIERAPGDIVDDPRVNLIRRGLEILLAQTGPHRAEQLQLLFSREYDPAWREQLNVRDGQR